MHQSKDPVYERGMPANVYAERMTLGSILLDDSKFLTVASLVKPEDFSLEKHKLIFQRMLDLFEQQKRIDRVTLSNELMRRGELEAVDGLSYLISLDEDLPEILKLEEYAQIVREKSILRNLIQISRETMERCFLQEDHPHEILSAAEASLLSLGEASTKETLLSTREILDRSEGVDQFLDTGRRIQGISTSYTKFDEMTGGLRGGELIILAARPAMGKTALALNIALHVATNKKRPRGVAVFSLEMSRESLLTRLICSQARVDQQRFRSGFLDDHERAMLLKAAADIYDAPIYIDDTSSTSLLDINAKLRRLMSQRRPNQPELGLCVVDYLQLMHAPSNLRRNANRVEEVAALSRGLKLMSKDLNIPFLVLSQLSRAPEQRVGDFRPQLSDLRESGSIEQDADMVAFIFRPEVYHKDRDDLRGRAELILAKQRNGPTGKIPLVFLHAFTRFENPADDSEVAPVD
jgi:replicative DNA helicase